MKIISTIEHSTFCSVDLCFSGDWGEDELSYRFQRQHDTSSAGQERSQSAFPDLSVNMWCCVMQGKLHASSLCFLAEPTSSRSDWEVRESLCWDRKSFVCLRNPVFRVSCEVSGEAAVSRTSRSVRRRSLRICKARTQTEEVLQCAGKQMKTEMLFFLWTFVQNPESLCVKQKRPRLPVGVPALIMEQLGWTRRYLWWNYETKMNVHVYVNRRRSLGS